MKIRVSVLAVCVPVAAVVAAIVLAAPSRPASDRPAPLHGEPVTAFDAASPTPAPQPPTAAPIDVTSSDQDLVDGENRFLAVDMAVVGASSLILVLCVGWLVVRLVRGCDL